MTDITITEMTNRIASIRDRARQAIATTGDRTERCILRALATRLQWKIDNIESYSTHRNNRCAAQPLDKFRHGDNEPEGLLKPVLKDMQFLPPGSEWEYTAVVDTSISASSYDALAPLLDLLRDTCNLHFVPRLLLTVWRDTKPLSVIYEEKEWDYELLGMGLG